MPRTSSEDARKAIHLFRCLRRRSRGTVEWFRTHDARSGGRRPGAAPGISAESSARRLERDGRARRTGRDRCSGEGALGGNSPRATSPAPTHSNRRRWRPRRDGRRPASPGSRIPRTHLCRIERHGQGHAPAEVCRMKRQRRDRRTGRDPRRRSRGSGGRRQLCQIDIASADALEMAEMTASPTAPGGSTALEATRIGRDGGHDAIGRCARVNGVQPPPGRRCPLAPPRSYSAPPLRAEGAPQNRPRRARAPTLSLTRFGRDDDTPLRASRSLLARGPSPTRAAGRVHSNRQRWRRPAPPRRVDLGAEPHRIGARTRGPPARAETPAAPSPGFSATYPTDSIHWGRIGAPPPPAAATGAHPRHRQTERHPQTARPPPTSARPG